MTVRDIKGNPGIWEELSWADLSSKEKELWAVLGWQEYKWDGNQAPASSDKDWNDLNLLEQTAAMNLGFSEDSWNSTDDE